MPHIDDDEYKVMDRMRDFCEDPNNLHLILKPAEKKTFRIGNIEGEITLIKSETAMYGWGGCGNNLGTRVLIKLVYRQNGKSFEEEIALGPAPYIEKKGPLRLAGNDVGDGNAAVHVGL